MLLGDESSGKQNSKVPFIQPKNVPAQCQPLKRDEREAGKKSVKESNK